MWFINWSEEHFILVKVGHSKVSYVLSFKWYVIKFPCLLYSSPMSLMQVVQACPLQGGNVLKGILAEVAASSLYFCIVTSIVPSLCLQEPQSM